jgi:hypothetical protein
MVAQESSVANPQKVAKIDEKIRRKKKFLIFFFRLDATRDSRLSHIRSKPSSWNLHVHENPGNKKVRLG